MNAIYIVTDCDLVGSIVHEIYMTELGEDWPVHIVPTNEIGSLMPSNGSVVVVAKEHNHYVRQVCHRYNLNSMIWATCYLGSRAR